MFFPQADDLRYFYEAAQTRNFSHAASRLGLSQPSLSVAIKRLEAAVGECLFFRKKTGVELTPAGLRMYEHTKEMIQLWEQVKLNARSSMREVQGNILMGCHPSVATYVLPTFLPDLLKNYENLSVELVHDLSRKITEEVADSKLDIGIVINPKPYPQLVMQKLGFDMVRLWSHKKGLEMADLKKKYTLLLDSELTQSQAILQRMSHLSLSPSRLIESRNLEILAELASCGSGVAILPTNVATRSQFKLFPVNGSPFFRDEVAAIMHVESKKVLALQVVMRAIKKGYLKST